MKFNKLGQQEGAGPKLDAGKPVVLQMSDDTVIPMAEPDLYHTTFQLNRRVLVLSVPRNLDFLDAANVLKEIQEAMEAE